MKRWIAWLFFCGILLRAAVQPPEKYFGFRIGSDGKLVRWDKIVEYLQTVAGDTDRVKFRNLGPTTLGNPFVLLEISSAYNLKNLDRYRQLERKLYFQGGAPTAAERDEIFRSGKAVVLVTANIHSTEIGASQMVLELVHRLATEDSPYIQKILDNVILLLAPSLNPDGQIMVTDWYNKVAGTPNEVSPLPWLYHPYTGHDNNRDMYLFSQKESRMTAQILWHEWFPAIWLDEHQQGTSGPRIFTMPATDPINPNVDPLIYRLNALFGQSQAAALEAEGKTGIIFNATYTNFWQGAMAWAGWWHNQVGLLTEVASARIASPVVQRQADPAQPAAAGAVAGGRGAATGPAGGASEFETERARLFEHPDDPLPPPRDVTPRTEYPRPWLGGKWTLRDIVDYELTATFALLDTAADRREALLRQIYDVNRNTIEAGRRGEIGADKVKTFAILIPCKDGTSAVTQSEKQHDPNEAIELVDKLLIAGVEVYRAKQDFPLDGKTYGAGTFVIPYTQVFARYAKDLLERQTYPEVRRSPGAPAEAPYDVSAWSLGLQFGVKTDFAKTPLAAGLSMDRVETTPKFVLPAVNSGGMWHFPYNGALSARIVNRLLKSGAEVSVTKPDGSGMAYAITTAKGDTWDRAAEGFEVRTLVRTPVAVVAGTLHEPRVGIYQSYDPSMDEGWTRFVLDQYGFEYGRLHNQDIRAGGLRQKLDAIILPDQRTRATLNGLDYKSILPEYRGGIGEAGWAALREFVAEGGTLIALGEASNLLVDKMPLGVKDLKRATTRDQHFAPGTIVNLQVDTTHPIGWGMAPETYGFYINSPFFQLTEGFGSQKVDVVARYPNTEVRASGWLRGEDLMYGRAAVVAIEMNPGKVVLFGIRPQHRAQTHATLPMLFNALYWSAEGKTANTESGGRRSSQRRARKKGL
jgi:hypothetical protein